MSRIQERLSINWKIKLRDAGLDLTEGVDWGKRRRKGRKWVTLPRGEGETSMRVRVCIIFLSDFEAPLSSLEFRLERGGSPGSPLGMGEGEKAEG